MTFCDCNIQNDFILSWHRLATVQVLIVHTLNTAQSIIDRCVAATWIEIRYVVEKLSALHRTLNGNFWGVDANRSEKLSARCVDVY